MTWRVPKIWNGGEVWIIGGGPSIIEQFEIPNEVVQKVREGSAPLSDYSPYLSSIHQKHIIAINAAYLLGDWIDMVFFGDARFYLENRTRLAKFPGLKITCQQTLNDGKYKGDRIKYLAKEKNKPKGIASDPGKVCWNTNSGSAAISVAANAGAKRIVLVGFDMALGEDRRAHFHSEYTIGPNAMPDRKLPFSKHLIGFKMIAEDARKRGIEIINACPDSVITQFRKIPVKEIINGLPNVKRITKDGLHIMENIEKGKRFEWLAEVIKKRGYKIGAEVGVARGKTTQYILETCPDLQLFAVDLWKIVPDEMGGGKQYREWNFRSIRNDFYQKTKPYQTRVTVLQGISWEVASKVEDKTLDFVFIDADHEYESVKKDIKAWSLKLKKGGMISGHDTHFPEVVKAIDELIPKWKATGVDHCWEAKKEDVKL